QLDLGPGCYRQMMAHTRWRVAMIASEAQRKKAAFLRYFSASNLALGILSQSLLVSTRKPWPLHAFAFMQLFFADAQAPCPLHALAPKHRPLASLACVVVETAPARTRAAAAAARQAPDRMASLTIIY